jgi:hypothetical protein
MKKPITKRSVVVAGMDLGDKESQVCLVNALGERVLERKVRTTNAGLRKLFGGLPACRVVLEAGTHARWVMDLLESLGHQVAASMRRPLRRGGYLRGAERRRNALAGRGLGVFPTDRREGGRRPDADGPRARKARRPRRRRT